MSNVIVNEASVNEALDRLYKVAQDLYESSIDVSYLIKLNAELLKASFLLGQGQEFQVHQLAASIEETLRRHNEQVQLNEWLAEGEDSEAFYTHLRDVIQ